MFFLSQLRLAINGLRRAPQFTLTAVFTLSLSIGTLIFAGTLASIFLFAPLPYADAERLVLVRQDLRGNGFSGEGFQTVRADLNWYRNNRMFERIALFMPGQEIIPDFKGEPKIPLAYVTADYVRVFGGNLVLGRSFSPQEEIGNKAKVILISESLWRSEYGGSPDVLEKFVSVQNVPHQIVGVVAANFVEPLSYGQRNELWLPFDSGGHYDAAWDQTFGALRFAGVLKPGVSREQAQRDLAESVAGLRDEWQSAWADLDTITPTVTAFRTVELGDFTRNSIAFAVAALALFLIALVNITSLFLSRAATRQYLVGLQSILGATRRQLTLSAMGESALIAALSAVLGLGVYLVLAWLIQKLGTGLIPLGTELGPRPLAVALALAAATFTSLFLSLANVGMLDRRNPLEHIRGAGHTRRSRTSRPLLNALAFVQLMLATAILIFAGTLAVRSFAQVGRPVNADIDRAYNVFAFILGAKLEKNEQYALGNELLQALERLPSVESAAHGSPPLDKTNLATDLVDSAKVNRGFFRAGFIGPDYLKLYGIRLLRGRDLSGDAYRGGAKEILVTDDAAQRLAADGNVLGTYVGQSDDEERYEIVGVTENVYDPQHYALDRGARVWWPYRPSPFRMQVKAKPGAQLDRAQVQSALRVVNDKLFVWEFNPLEDTYDAAVFRDRIVLVSLSVLSVVTLLLALSGIYGLVSYQVRLIARDIGIRLVIGARHRDILLLGLRRFGGIIVLALVTALGLVWGVWKLAQTALAGIYEPSWPVTVAALAITGICAFAATILPVRRLLSRPPAQLITQG